MQQFTCPLDQCSTVTQQAGQHDARQWQAANVSRKEYGSSCGTGYAQNGQIFSECLRYLELRNKGRRQKVRGKQGKAGASAAAT